MKLPAIVTAAVALALALPVATSAQAPEPASEEAAEPAAVVDRGALEPEPEPAQIKFRLKNVNGGKVDVGERFTAVGTVGPFVPGQMVKVLVKRGKKTMKRALRKVKRAGARGRIGRFEITTPRIIKPARYRVRANKLPTPEQERALAATRKVRVDFPNLDPGDGGKQVRLFNKLLGKQAYHGADGRRYGSGTARAVLAFHKVNNMARTTNASRGDFRKLARGKGGFKLEWPGGGKHVETDLSRQVMVLAKNGKAKHIFHISSGAPATPTIRGKMTFFRKQYGRNSLGMVHSVYFGPTNRGYATHGYPSVPTYPASHGCLRNPIPNSLFIYKWIDIGDWIYVYP